MRSIIILIALLSVVGCDKEKQTSRKIKGQWDLVHMKATFSDGLSEYGTGSGSLKITESDQDNYQCKFERQTDMQFPSISYLETRTGYKTFKNKGKYSDSYLVDVNNVVVFQEAQRILMLTNTDLQIEYTSSTGQFVTQTYRRKK
jgi:hypothetical protein